MKIGCCVSYNDLNRLKTAKKLGYDFVEASVNPMINASDADIDAFISALEENGLSCPSVNCLFPGDIRLCGPDADLNAASEYLDRVFTISAKIGYDRVVFGSGGPRRVPDGFSHDAAAGQIRALCSDVLEPVMAKFGMICCVEELNRRECNILTTCAETIALVRELRLPHIGFLLDFYHAGMEGETNFSGFAREVTHVHIASAKNKRAFPADGDGEDYAGFFKFLRDSGYEEQSGLVTIEGNDFGDFEGASKKSLELLRRI